MKTPETQTTFWAREYAYYLNEHKHPKNRATHMIGIPLLIISAIIGLTQLSSHWQLGLAWLIGGQIIGWIIQIIGHKIEGNKPALFKRPISFIMGPLMVLAELAECVGIHPRFASEGRRIAHDL